MFSIGFDDPSLASKAQGIASRLNLKVDNNCLPRLIVTADKLFLLAEKFKPLFVDFENIKKQPGLIKAIHPKSGKTIIDATAGWGKDAAFLASMGSSVLMLEKNPIMHALLEDGLQRFKNSQLSLKNVDAYEYLNKLKKLPDIIYLDPMHPPRLKDALVKKDLQVLQSFIEPNAGIELLPLALKRVKEKVVVKWPAKLPPILKSDYSIKGKTIRFDVYLSK